MKTSYMLSIDKNYTLENLINDKYAENEEGIKAIIANHYYDLYNKQTYDFKFNWQKMEVSFMTKVAWDDEDIEDRLYIVPIYQIEIKEAIYDA